MLVAALVIVLFAFALRPLVGPVFTEGALYTFDTSHAQWWRDHESAEIVRVMRAVSALHGTIGILTLSALLAWWLVQRGQAAWAVHVMLTVAGGLLMNTAVKNVFSRSRPTFGGVPASLHSFSFPSGHTVGATLFYGLVAMVAFALTRRLWPRLGVLALAASMVLWVATSRFYLGAHFVSDTAAGFVVGLLWLACGLGSWPKHREARAVDHGRSEAGAVAAASSTAHIGS